MGRDKQSGKSRKSSRKEAANDALPQGDLYGWSQDGQAGDYMPDKLGDSMLSFLALSIPITSNSYL